MQNWPQKSLSNFSFCLFYSFVNYNSREEGGLLFFFYSLQKKEILQQRRIEGKIALFFSSFATRSRHCFAHLDLAQHNFYLQSRPICQYTKKLAS